MKKGLLIALAVAGLSTVAARAQNAPPALDAAATALGTARLTSIEFSGWGSDYIFGQPYDAHSPWPRFGLPAITISIDYTTPAWRDDRRRTQVQNPPLGGGTQPLAGEQRQIWLLSGSYAWDVVGQNAVPAAPERDQRTAVNGRLAQIWLTPHGFIKAAIANNATVTSETVRGAKKTWVAFTTPTKARFEGMLNDQHLVERIETWYDNPILGDMMNEVVFKEYKDFGGVKFPTLLHSHQGDIRRNIGENSIEVRVSNVQANVNVPVIAIPEAVRKATVPPVRVESQKVADGVWHIAGGTHHSLAVDFRDFVAVIEAPQNEERSLAVIAEVEKLIPNKPIRYLVNTHHHFDHLGGLRTYATMGTTIVTHEGNREFYEDTVLSSTPRTVQPDRFSSLFPYTRGGRRPEFETLNGKYVVSDGVRVLEIHHVEGLAHNANMLIAYLPKEKILVNADLYSPPPQGAPAPAPNPNMMALFRNIQRLKLDVAQHVPLHGRIATMDEFVKIVQTAKTQ